MANPRHLEIVQQGTKAIHKWRTKNPNARLDINGANLVGAKLSGADLSHANLSRADLSDSNLSRADLSHANLSGANLSGAILYAAHLSDAILYAAHLSDANLSDAVLYWTSFYSSTLNATTFTGAKFGGTVLNDVDLSKTKGLESVAHLSPSSIDIHTFIASKGKIPREFLRGTGMPDNFIDYNLECVNALSPIQFHSCFISYNHEDEALAKTLHDRLTKEGISVWYAPEKLRAGKKIHLEIEKGIRLHDKLLLLLSPQSMKSDWVEHEIRSAREREREGEVRKLFPIALCPFADIKKWKLFDADEGRDLAKEIREYYIPNFTNWDTDPKKFDHEFDLLLDALKKSAE